VAVASHPVGVGDCQAARFDEPTKRTFPSLTSSSSAARVSSSGVTPSKKWYW